MMAKQNRPQRKGGVGFNPIWIYVGIFVALIAFWAISGEIGQYSKELSWNEFQSVAKRQAFSKVSVDRSNPSVEAVVRPHMVDSVFRAGDLPARAIRRLNQEYVVRTIIPSVDKFSDFCDENQLNAEVVYTERSFSLWTILLQFGPLFLLILFWVWMMRRMNTGGGGAAGGGVFSVGKSKAQLYDKTGVNVTFSDVAGLQEAKQEIEEIVHFLKYPKELCWLALRGRGKLC